MNRQLSRRRLLGLGLGSLAAGGLVACSDDPPEVIEAVVEATEVEPTPLPPTPAATATPVPTATPAPLIVAAGVEERTLMAGTPSENTAVILGSGREGPIVLVLGGVHGNEPGGWLAAEQLVAWEPPARGALLVIPRANVIATQLFERTTEELGDLNRLYPGDLEGLPMARMAHAIVELAREFRVALAIDMHESWAFYKDRSETQGGTAFLGQTISSADAGGASLGQEIAAAVNQRILYPHEEMTFRSRPSRSSFGGGGRGRSSLGLPQHVPGLSALLVEMGQQQALERRVVLHIEVVNEALRRRGLYDV